MQTGPFPKEQPCQKRLSDGGGSVKTILFQAQRCDGSHVKRDGFPGNFGAEGFENPDDGCACFHVQFFHTLLKQIFQCETDPARAVPAPR